MLTVEKPVPRSMQPNIPEPRCRVGPKGVSSGLSFRKLPRSSLGQIRKICDHYETKCHGTKQYSSLASRYLIQMVKEVKEQITALEELEERESDRRTARELRETLLEWKEHFRGEEEEPGDEGGGSSPQRRQRRPRPDSSASPDPSRDEPPVSNDDKDDDGGVLSYRRPREVKEELLALRARVRVLENDLVVARDDAERTRRGLETELENHAEAFRRSAEVDREQQRHRLDETREDCRREIERVRRGAERAVETVRRRAAESLRESVRGLRRERAVEEEEAEEERRRMRREHESAMHELDYRTKHKERLEKEAVEERCKRLRHQHAVELAEAARNGIVKGYEASTSSFSSSSSNRHGGERRRGRVAGRCEACGDFLDGVANGSSSRQDPGSSSTDNNVDGNDAKENMRNRKLAQQEADSALWNLKLRSKEDECLWLKKRVQDLENMMDTIMAKSRFSNNTGGRCGRYC